MSNQISDNECDAVQFRHIDWHIGDWLGGTLGMGLEHEGAYCRFLNRLYQRGKPLIDDDRIMATLMGLSLRVWKRVRAALIEAGKIVAKGGCLTNPRFERERVKRAERIRQQAANAHARWAAGRENAEVCSKFDPSLAETSSKLSAKVEKKPRKIKVASDATAMPPIPIPIPLEEERSPNGDSSVAAQTDLPGLVAKQVTVAEAMRLAMAAWNAMADKHGLSKVVGLNKKRIDGTIARIRECGGLQRWIEIIEKVPTSAFLLGDNDRGWKAHFDWACQPSSFTKLMEGAYGGQRPPQRPSASGLSFEEQRRQREKDWLYSRPLPEGVPMPVEEDA